jgi:trans-aconitate methyltransferase
VRHVVQSLVPGEAEAGSTIVDLGCGTGAAGAALGSHCGAVGRVIGIDRNAWALNEAMHTYRAFDLPGRTRRADVTAVAFPNGRALFVAAFTMNELNDADRDVLFAHLLQRARRGDPVLVVEPLAGSAARWWAKWKRDVEAAGGRADEWRLKTTLPDIVAKLDRAAGLDHREITGRTFWIAGRATRS